MGLAAKTIHAIADTAHDRINRRNFRLLDFSQAEAWREFQHWQESLAAHGVPAGFRYRSQPRQERTKPSIEDRYIWALDMGRSFAKLAPTHQAILLLLVSGDSIAMAAHKHGTSTRTLMRRREAALAQLAAIRRQDKGD
jgi:hypothetical protein